jgi:hypothetical protein
MPISGRDLEDRLRSKLGDLCRIDHDEVFDHQYKIDFIVSRFKTIPRITDSIGVQVTVRDDDDRKQTEFLDIHQEQNTIPRAVYLDRIGICIFSD